MPLPLPVELHSISREILAFERAVTRVYGDVGLQDALMLERENGALTYDRSYYARLEKLHVPLGKLLTAVDVPQLHTYRLFFVSGLVGIDDEPKPAPEWHDNDNDFIASTAYGTDFLEGEVESNWPGSIQKALADKTAGIRHTKPGYLYRVRRGVLHKTPRNEIGKPVRRTLLKFFA